MGTTTTKVWRCRWMTIILVTNFSHFYGIKWTFRIWLEIDVRRDLPTHITIECKSSNLSIKLKLFDNRWRIRKSQIIKSKYPEVNVQTCYYDYMSSLDDNLFWKSTSLSIQKRNTISKNANIHPTEPKSMFLFVLSIEFVCMQ